MASILSWIFGSKSTTSDPLEEVEDVVTDQEAEQRVMESYDNYLEPFLGVKPSQKVHLLYNTFLLRNHCWIPSDHPLAITIHRTLHGKQLRHYFDGEYAGSCCVYSYHVVLEVVDEVFAIYVKHERMVEEEE